MNHVTQENAASAEELAAAMAMFRTSHDGAQDAPRRKGKAAPGRRLAALPENTGGDDRF